MKTKETWIICPECGNTMENVGRWPELYNEGTHRIICDDCGEEINVETRITTRYDFDT